MISGGHYSHRHSCAPSEHLCTESHQYGFKLCVAVVKTTDGWAQDPPTLGTFPPPKKRNSRMPVPERTDSQTTGCTCRRRNIWEQSRHWPSSPTADWGRLVSSGQTALHSLGGLGDSTPWQVFKKQNINRKWFRSDILSFLLQSSGSDGTNDASVLWPAHGLSGDPGGSQMSWPVCSLTGVTSSFMRAWEKGQAVSMTSGWKCHHDNSGGVGSRQFANFKS